MLHTHETHEIEIPCCECDATVDVELLLCCVLAQDVNIYWDVPSGWALRDEDDEDEDYSLLCPLCLKHQATKPEAPLATP